jgi:hypothetical protein
MNEPLAKQALPHPGLAQGLHGRLFQHAGADPALDMRATRPLEHARLDARHGQHLAQHEAGRAGANDGDASAKLQHRAVSSSGSVGASLAAVPQHVRHGHQRAALGIYLDTVGVANAAPALELVTEGNEGVRRLLGQAVLVPDLVR